MGFAQSKWHYWPLCRHEQPILFLPPAAYRRRASHQSLSLRRCHEVAGAYFYRICCAHAHAAIDADAITVSHLDEQIDATCRLSFKILTNSEAAFTH